MRRVCQALIAIELATIAIAGVVTVARFPVWSLVDERAHFDFVQKVADERRLPDARHDLISPEAEALDERVYPRPPRIDPRTRGLAGLSYEGVQPPLYYVGVAPFSGLMGDHLAKVRLLRALGLALLFATAWLLWRLTRRVLGEEDHLPAYALALTVLLWPGVVVRSATVSNAALELPLAVAATYALWRAHDEDDQRWLLGAGGLVGAGLLTKLSLAFLVPGLVGVAVAHARGRRSGGKPDGEPDGGVAAGAAGLGLTLRRTAALAVALPALILAPWLISNLHRYGAPTAMGATRDLFATAINPRDLSYGLGDLPGHLHQLLNGVLPEEWGIELLPAGHRAIRDVFVVGFGLVPVLIALALPFRGRRRAALLLVAPLVFAVLLIGVLTLAQDLDYFIARYLNAALPGFAVFGALAFRHAVGDRGVVSIAGVLTIGFVALWLHLSAVTPFVVRPTAPPAAAASPPPPTLSPALAGPSSPPPLSPTPP